ncbi:hypothetical protein ISN44_As04g004650 [Arabidopsis suecica]|uniref:Uncharacterized protein n=2 Tax=Arabidopsis TaxID=3701 RepID=A0A8T2E5T8_ARASU|nr:hypothetical protein ISN44_As04g004650 [Arabidopsis suecica]
MISTSIPTVAMTELLSLGKRSTCDDDEDESKMALRRLKEDGGVVSLIAVVQAQLLKRSSTYLTCRA